MELGHYLFTTKLQLIVFIGTKSKRYEKRLIYKSIQR